MLRKEKYSSLLKAPSFSLLLLVFCIHSFAPAQEADIIVLSRKVGTTLDAEEKEILGLFPDVAGYQSAQFFKIDDDRYLARIVYLDHTQPRILKRYYSWRQLQKMKYIAGSHPEITEEMRAELRHRLSYLRVDEILGQIPQSTFCTIRHANGRKISGNFVEYRDRTICFQSPTRRIRFPITEIESISYRPIIEAENPLKKGISFAAGALAGVGLAELWNVQSRPSIDGVWQNRFTGLALGLLSGNEVFEAFTILTSPKRFIPLTPEEVEKLK